MARIPHRLPRAAGRPEDTSALATAVRRLRTASTADRSRSVRAFFETHFIPYRVAAADGRDVGRVTGYYEPLLKGSRAAHARNSACRCTRRPTTC